MSGLFEKRWPWNKLNHGGGIVEFRVEMGPFVKPA